MLVFTKSLSEYSFGVQFAWKNRELKLVVLAILGVIFSAVAPVGAHAQTFSGTTLSPGDVYMTIGNEGKNNKATCNLGFVFLVDVASGTKVAFTREKWLGGVDDTSFDAEDLEGFVWTAPIGGVTAGTEVVCRGVGGFADASIEGTAIKATTASPISLVTSGEDYYTGGESCGSWVALNGGVEHHIHGDHLWLFQPADELEGDDSDWDVDWKDIGYSDVRMLSCVGKDLDKSHGNGPGNTAVNTLLYSANNSPNEFFNDDYSAQAAPFGKHQWRFNATTAATVAGDNLILSGNVMGEIQGLLKSSNNYSEISTSINDIDDDQLPVGNLSNSMGLLWTTAVVTEGSSTLDVTISNADMTFVVDKPAVSLQNLTITNGKFVACDGSGRCTSASGDILLDPANTCVFNGGQGVFEFNGDDEQTIDANNSSDASSSKVQFKGIQVTNGKKLKVKGHVKMKSGGSLLFDDTVTGDQLELDGTVISSLTFQSDGTQGTAAIGACDASNFEDGVDQTFTFERFIPSDTDNSWVNIGAYVTGTTVSDWTSGVSGMLLFEYNEASYGSQAAGWNYLWDGTAVLTPGNGYMALVPSGVSGTISVTGKFEMGDVTLPLTFTDDPNQSDVTVDGWNLVSNPYPAPVNMVSVLAHTENALVTAYYLFDNTGAGSYVETLADGTGGAPTTLDVGQSIWVKVDQNTSITFKESDKVVGTSGTFVRELDPSFQGSIGLGIANDSEQWAHAFVRFDEAATAAFIPSEDALHLNTEVHSDLRVWMEAENGEHLSIQSAGSLENTPSLPLHVTSGAGGDVVFSMVEQETMPANLCAVIEDTETGERGQLGMDAFVVNLPANTLYEERFVLHFNAMPSLSLTSTVCDGLDVTELEGEWDAWSLTWSSDDGTASGEGMPYDLANGDYTFTYALPSVACANEVDVEVNAACLGDFNLNGERDIIDLLFLLAGLPGNNGAANIDFETADCDCDGVVTVSDMLTFLTVFASQCD